MQTYHFIAAFCVIGAVALAGCDSGPPCGPTRDRFQDGSGFEDYCGMKFSVPAEGGTISISGTPEKPIKWEQLELLGMKEIRVSINSPANTTSPALGADRFNLGVVKQGLIDDGDTIQLCGPTPAIFTLNSAGWPYAPPPNFNVRLPACQ